MKTIQEIKTEFLQVLNDVFSGVKGITLEQSISATTQIIQEAGKHTRQEVAIKSNNFESNAEKPISEKQASYLKDLGAESIPKTSREANILITELKAKRGSNYSNRRGGFSAPSFK